MVVTEAGISIAESKSQPLNAEPPMYCKPSGNAIADSPPQSLNAELPMRVTDDGMDIPMSAVPENARSPIVTRPFGKDTDSRFRQFAKASAARTLTPAGIAIDGGQVPLYPSTTLPSSIISELSAKLSRNCVPEKTPLPTSLILDDKVTEDMLKQKVNAHPSIILTLGNEMEERDVQQ